MEENEKPFGCMAEGCNMRFTNEDHLTVHKKKHDMILNLGNGQKMNIFVADQTPTPTRFIRNCEEVGLFQDLQNVNPFEETFRKAVEAGKTGLALHDVNSLHIPTGVDDTLHTPHVFPFPHMNEEPSHYKSSNLLSHDNSKCKSRYSDESLLRSSSSDCSNGPIQTAELFNRSSTSNSTITLDVPNINNRGRPSDKVVEKGREVVDKETVTVAGKSMQLYLRMPDGKLLQLVQENSKPVPTTSTPASIPSPENGLALAKMKLKQALKKNGRIPTSGYELEERARVSSVEVTAPPTPSLHQVPPRGGSSNGSGDEEDDKKLKFRERNRAAAMRCREKRKTWVQELERRAEEMQSTNQHLQSEVTSLRAEVAQLKTLLLAHRNCPITQAMNQAQMMNMSSVPITTIQNSLEPITQRVKTVYQPTPTVSHQKSIIVLRKPSKVRRTTMPETKAKHKKLDGLAPTTSSDTVTQTAPLSHTFAHKPAETSDSFRTTTCDMRNGSVTSMPVSSMNVSIQSVVVANPVATSQTLYSQSQFLMPLTLDSGHPPPLVSFDRSSSCASNENNLNLEKIIIDGSYSDNEVNVPKSEVGSDSMTIDGSESKVIKVNPNAIRFNTNKRYMNIQDRKLMVRTETQDDSLEMIVYQEREDLNETVNDGR